MQKLLLYTQHNTHLMIGTRIASRVGVACRAHLTLDVVL